MNSLQQELNNINQQLEHLNARKAQLEPIVSEYTDVINRVKNLTENMIALNIEPTNLRFDLEDILEGNEAGDWVREADIFASEPDTTPEPTPEPQPGQDFPTDWIDATTEAHSEQPEDYDTFYPKLTPEPQPVKMFAFVPLIPTPTPELTQEPTPEPTPEPDLEECPKCEGEGVIESPIEEDQICPACGGTGEKTEPTPEPKLTQINMQAYRRDDVLVIGFTNKRLKNQWSKWFKSTWSDQVHVSDHSDNLQGFNYCLTVLWFGNPHWERLTKLNYSLKPTEQNRTLGQVASSESEKE